MESKMESDRSEAKRSRYDSGKKGEEDYEIELHHSGPTDDFGVEHQDYVWESDEEENVKVEIRKKDQFQKPGQKFSENGKNLLKRPREERSHQGVNNFEKETDQDVIARRTKQIEYGKNTPEYFNYQQAVPRDDRKAFHPRTPNKYRKYSRRAWDGAVRQWRINLHCWSDYPIPASEQLAGAESELAKLNDSFTSEASGSTSTTSSVAAAFTAELGFLNKYGSRSASESENELNTSGQGDDLNSTVVEVERGAIKDQMKTKMLSTSWADDVEDYFGDNITS